MEINFPCKLLSCIEVPPWITSVLRGWDYGIVILLVILLIFLAWRIISLSLSVIWRCRTENRFPEISLLCHAGVTDLLDRCWSEINFQKRKWKLLSMTRSHTLCSVLPHCCPLLCYLKIFRNALIFLKWNGRIIGKYLRPCSSLGSTCI